MLDWHLHNSCWKTSRPQMRYLSQTFHEVLLKANFFVISWKIEVNWRSPSLKATFGVPSSVEMTTLSCFQPFIIHFTFLLLSFQSCILLKFVESAICWMSVSDLPVPMKSLRRLTSLTGSCLEWVYCTVLCFHTTETYLHCDKKALTFFYEFPCYLHN